MAIKPGDFVLLNYTLKVKESGETVDTTLDSVAKDSHIHSQETVYGPKFVILGEGWIPKGLEDALTGLEPGKQTVVELSPDKGYGNRDPSKMKLVSMRRFREKGIDPAPGARIEFDGKPAVVRAVGAGRVQVDYNHPLAGRTLIYDVSVEKVLEDETEKLLSIVSRRIPEIGKEKFTVRKDGVDLTVEIPEEAFYLSGLQVAKKAITSDIQKFLQDIGSISFLETFRRSSEEPTTGKTETTPPATPPPSPQVETENAPPRKETAPSEAEKRGAPVSKKTARPARRRPRPGSENQR